MRHRTKVIFQVSILLLSFGCAKGYADLNMEQQAAVLLLQQYETVVSVRSKALAQLHLDQQPNQEIGRRYLSLPFVSLMVGLRAVGPNTLAALEGGSDTVLTGAKAFERPEGLGMVHFRTCYIAILTPGAAQTLPLEFSKVKSTLIQGRSVWTWSMPLSEGEKTNTTFYAAIVTGGLFLLANDAQDFAEVASAGTKSTENTDLLKNLDLTSLRAHAYWAYRAIRRGEGIDTFASGLSALPVSAVALELFTELDDARLVFNILVPDDRSGSTPAGLLSSDAIRFQRAGSGVWQAVISLTTTRQTTSAVFQAMACFGYGVAL